ncbi:MAG: hypothetical protein GTO03_03765, partial [Planctomycetales bacterium]|nr:hypothetical protein [Planctomycetales bacterium]
RQLSRLDRTSWDYLSQHGSHRDVIQYLQANNVNRIALERIAWRMRDPEFFQQVIRLLARRHVYNHTLWSYAIKHGDVPAIRQYLQHADDFVRQCGDYLVSPLLVIDPVI